MEFDDIVMIGELTANISLSKDSLHLVILGDVRFLKLLQRKLLARAASQVDLSISAPS